MDKKQIIRYISGRAGTLESQKVLEWIDENPQNRAFYNELKNTWVISNMPDNRANKSDWDDLHQRIGKPHRFIKIVCFCQKIAAILFIPLLLAFIYVYSNGSDKLSNNEYITYYANKGIKSRLSLPDGTKVWLNSDSYLKCPPKFTGGLREVSLSGEAYFEVANDSDKPFTVNAGSDVSIMVTGTSFNVSSYKDDNMIYATLVSGNIDFIVNNFDGTKKEIIQMDKNDFVSYYSINGEVKKSKIDPYITTSWRKGWLCFENATLREVTKKLSRWYGVNFTIKSPDLADMSLTAKFSSESISQVMELIKRSTVADYVIDENSVTIFQKK